MGLWNRIFAAGYDRMMSAAEEAGLSAHRESLLSAARGRVLEIGGGTGANLRFYGREVLELVLTEPEEPMVRRLTGKLSGSRIPTRVLRAPAEDLPLEAGSFDCAVTTLVLCTVSEPARALGEIRRLLRPGGRLLFLEHVRSDDPKLARWQDRLSGVWSWVGCGCRCNRRTLEAIEAAGFAIGDLRREQFPKAAPLVRPLVIGTASRPS
jgi:ubiquinone/menaquinone biosynthesis C-methylase UbiE